MTPPSIDPEALRLAIGSGDPGRSMPALVALRDLDSEQAVPLLLLGLEQEAFLVRSLSCAGLGYKRTEEGWQGLVRALREDLDANVRAEAANALVSHSLERAWPLLLQAFEDDDPWLVRCSILSAVAEHPSMKPADLLTLARLAIADADGTVRVGGAEVLGRLRLEGQEPWAEQARQELGRLQQDGDHRVVAAALNGLSS
jgi:HEAT repeat protein